MARDKILEPTPEMNQLLVKAGSMNREESLSANTEIAKALELPLRKGLFDGDITSGIYETVKLQTGASPEWPLDFIAPGTEKNFSAYTIPNHGRIPEKHVEGDYVMIPMYEIGGSIDMLLKYARDARWDVVNRAMTALRAQFTQKINDDAWQTIIAAGVDRNLYVYDADANSGQFTKRVVSLAKTIMRRNSGGNSASTNRGLLTDIFISPEGLEDIRNWGIDQVDETTRREIFIAADGAINRIFGVNLHDIDELGEGQAYQLFYTNQMSGSMASGDVEIAIGLDLSKNDCFVMPVREGLQIFEDETLHRQRRMGWYGWQEHGFAALDSRRTIILTY
jgi:hypothetical protein